MILPDGDSLNSELVRTGYAWWYRKYASKNFELMILQDTSRKLNAGLWADTAPVAPWEFRRRRKKSSRPQTPRKVSARKNALTPGAPNYLCDILKRLETCWSAVAPWSEGGRMSGRKSRRKIPGSNFARYAPF
ncbi:hypothetical protein BMS3Abin14_01049 [bacterium BMS3Abin14]|nr:hypothetical protein BMS3Abin14_01049 [bacterium BMS3Abin14]